MSGNFKDRVDAAVASGDHGESGFWFFQENLAVKTDASGGSRAVGPDTLTKDARFWPALEGTIFENGPIDAVVHTDSGYWFFQGSQCVKTRTDGAAPPLVPVSDITAAGNWPALNETIFANGVDGAVGSGDHGKNGFWFFRENQAVKTDVTGATRSIGPADITAQECWPALEDTEFADGPIQAGVYSASGFWFFKGSKCVKVNHEGTGTPLVSPSPIIAAGNWPALDV
jgi:hypothetical protein